MPAPIPHEVRAAAVADFHAGLSAAEVARRHGVKT